ncbi:MAG: AraC family transcriptional regulator [Hyphomicrobiaceae bacterium]|nr:AraC family transcriptional regulator [Hyphomicrobiaceae bacterium]
METTTQYEDAMGAYGFNDLPTYDRLITPFPSVRLIRSVGGEAGWNMPVSVWHAPSGIGEEVAFDALPHDCIAFSLQGEIECVRGSAAGRRGKSRSDFFTLQLGGHESFFVSRDETRFVHINFGPALWRAIAEEIVGSVGAHSELRPDRVFFPDRDLRRMIDRYVARALTGDTPPAIEMDSQANLIALALLKSHSSLPIAKEFRPMALPPARLTRVKDFIEANLDRDLGLADIAAAAELSPFHFARAFKHQTGVPPHHYLMERRVDRARQLLAASQVSLAEIALACGFAGQSHFTTAFKRHTGVTPGAWRAAVCS